MPASTFRVGSRWPVAARLAVVAVSLAAYAMVVLALRMPPYAESQAMGGSAWMLPATAWFALVVAGGWLLGRRGGVLFGVLMVPFHAALIYLHGRDGIAEIAGPYGAGTLLFSVLMAGFSGALAEYYHEARTRAIELRAKNEELERASQALAQSEAMFRQFAERVGVGVWIAPATARERMYVNPAARALFGDAQGNEWIERIHPDDRKCALAAGRALATGEPQSLEYRVARAGGFAWVHAQSFAVHDDRGEVTTFAGILEDVTERKDREMRREALERRERLSALGTLVAGVAHEVNNPLTYLAGNMQLAHAKIRTLRTPPDDRAIVERVDRLLETSIEGADRIARIVKALRAVTRAPIEGMREVVRLNAIASNVHELIHTSVPPTIDLKLDLAPDDPVVLGSGSELHQVLLNLATNAVQAMGGMSGAVTIGTRLAGGEAYLVVQDEGPGIPAETRARLFTPFFTTKPDGTGLGLSIAHAITRDHGGEIDVESRPGEGALFRVRLPLPAAAPAAGEAIA